MAVAALISEERDIPFVLRWAARAAQARSTELIVVEAIAKKGESRTTELTVPGEGKTEGTPPLSALAYEEVCSLFDAGRLATRESEAASDEEKGNGARNEKPAEKEQAKQEGEGGGSDGASHSGTSGKGAKDDAKKSIAARVIAVQHPDLVAAICKELERREVDLLLLPRHDPLDEQDLKRLLYRRAPCEVVLLRPPVENNPEARCERVLVPLSSGAHARSALRFGREIASPDGEVTALFVEPEVGADAETVGGRILDRFVARTVGAEADGVRRKVVLADKVQQGIVSAIDETHDLVVVGASRHGLMVRRLFGSLSERLMVRKEGPAIAAVRSALPLTGRLWGALERRLQRLVPQLERESRVRLVERVQSNSQWDFDFIALVCLSTSIATLGLTQNSTAVVIGAMLVAPLMTPLLGMGLALAQGNAVLSRSAARAVVLGFLLAFAIAYGIGSLLPELVEPTSEMLARGSPGLLDFLVAFASGVAAAYAVSRPDLSAALPGVAIAAALVPPIATSGLAGALGDGSLALGAALLFVTNIVSIVLGATASLWLVGVRRIHPHGRIRSWTVRALVVLVLLTLSLALSLAFRSRQLQPAVLDAIEARLAPESDTLVLEANWVWSEGTRHIHLTIASPRPLAKEMTDGIAAAVRSVAGEGTGLRIETRLVATRVGPEEAAAHPATNEPQKQEPEQTDGESSTPGASQ